MTTDAAPVIPPHSNPAIDTAFAQSPLGFKLRAVLTEERGTNVAIADFLLRNPVRATAAPISSR